jgi:hypothetical protein
MNSDGGKAVQAAESTCSTCGTTCQKCRSGKMLHVVFGYITNQMMEDEAAGKIVLGGCLMPSSPKHQCNACHAFVGSDDLSPLWRKPRS